MNIENHKIIARMKSWTETDWDGVRENYSEYKGALGDEATKGLIEFAFGIAAQNELYAMLMEAKA